MVDEWRVGRGSKIAASTWSNIVSTWSRVEGRGSRPGRGKVERSRVECPYRLPYMEAYTDIRPSRDYILDLRPGRDYKFSTFDQVDDRETINSRLSMKSRLDILYS